MPPGAIPRVDGVSRPSPNTLAGNMPQNATISDNLFDWLFGVVPSIAYPNIPVLVASEQNVTIFPTNPRDPVSTNWLFGVEQQVAPETVLTINYTGNRVQHTQAGVAFQALNFNPQSPNTNVGRPLAAKGVPYQNENYYPNILFSKYNALQVQLRRNARALQLEANYAWSHEMDDEVNVFAGYEDPMNPLLDRGNGDWDVNQNLSASAVYNLPVFAGRSRLMQETAGGWQASSILQARSGMAQNVEVTNGFFGNFMRPNYVTGKNPRTGKADWPNQSYNIQAYALAPGFNGVYGDPFPALLPHTWYWALDGFVAGRDLWVTLLCVRHDPTAKSAAMDFATCGTDLAHIPDPGPDPQKWKMQITPLVPDGTHAYPSATAVVSKDDDRSLDRRSVHLPRSRDAARHARL
jgi:hypothetical protein